MYKGVSVSPAHGSFAPGFVPPPSDLENLVAGGQRKVRDLVDQAVSQRLLRGDVDISGSAGDKHLVGQGGPLPQNAFCPGFVALSGVKGGL